MSANQADGAPLVDTEVSADAQDQVADVTNQEVPSIDVNQEIQKLGSQYESLNQSITQIAKAVAPKPEPAKPQLSQAEIQQLLQTNPLKAVEVLV
jgi:hypothetical protein